MVKSPQESREGDNCNESSLSDTQERVWFLEQLDPGSAAQHTSLALEIKGELDAAVLRQSLHQVAQRHDILRASLASAGGRPVQKVVADLVPELPVVDLSGHPDPERKARVQQAFSQEVHRPFDLSRPPLWRTTLLKLGAEDHVLVLILHQLIGDVPSARTLIQETAGIYQALIRGIPPPPRSPSQYADLACQEKEWLKSDQAHAQLSYWLDRLGGDLPVLELPADHLRPAMQTFRGAHYTFTLSRALIAPLRILSQQAGVGLKTALLATLQVLLYRYTGQEDIIVGSPAPYPRRDESKDVIGPLDNVLPLRTHLSSHLTFRELLGRAHETIQGAYANQDLPFGHLVNVLRPARSLRHSPLFQVMFDFQVTEPPPTALSEMGWYDLGLQSDISRYDLSLVWKGEGDELAGVVEYNTDLFDQATIARLADHFQTLLAAASANPGAPLSRLATLTDVERQQLVTVWNQTEAEFPRQACIHTLFEAQANRTPEATAVVFPGERITYRELDRRANQLAHYLQNLGVGPEVPVGVCLKRSIDLVAGLLGVLKAGGAYVPLDPAYPPERLAFMLEDTAARVLLTQSCLLPRLPKLEAHAICLDTDRESYAQESAASPTSTVVSDNLAYVIYTSGSTGRPKGVAIAHSSAVAMLGWAAQVFPAEDLRGVLASTSICFDLSIYELFLPLSQGGTVILAENALHLPNLPDRDSVTLINTVPSAIAELIQVDGIPGSVRTVNLAGEPLKRALVQQVYQRANVRRVYNLYGPSEDTTYSTFALVERDDPDEPTIGRPVSNTQAYILDPHMELVPVGVVGELYLGGAGLSRGYLNRPALTAATYLPDPFGPRPGARLYRTGDLARYRSDGEIQFLGRGDHQVKIRGFRIELGEIESVLSRHPGLKAVAVLARQDTPGDRRLVAYLVANQAPPPTVNELRRFLQAKLPDYMLPVAYVYLDTMPLTPNGKINRRALPAPAPDRPGLEETFVAPRTAIEKKLASIWRDVLHLETVGAHDDFFALGGESLLASQVISRLRQIFSVEIPLAIFFKQPTIAGLAQEIAQRDQEERRTIPLVPTVRDGPAPLSFSQQQMWFLDQLAPNCPVYNVPVLFQVNGSVDGVLLERCLNEIVRRHEVLHTRFTQVDDQPVQVVFPLEPLRLSMVDLRPLPAETRDASARQLMDEQARQPFDLSQGPLLRALLLQLHDQLFQLLLTIHHIVFDGWSTGVVMEELAALYAAFARGQPSPLPELSIQYIDFTHWQREYLKESVLAEHLDYWRTQFKDEAPLLTLPTDRTRPAVQSYRGAKQSRPLAAALVGALNALARQENASLFMTLFAAFQTLLYRYSGQLDIVVGVPAANRNRPEIEGMVGCFTNTIPLRTNLGGNPTFRELIGRIRPAAFGAYAHQDFPLDHIIQSIRLKRDPSYNPLFQVMFDVQNLRTNSVQLPDGRFSFVEELNTGTAKVDLTLFVELPEQGPAASIEYNADLFDEITIHRMLAHFQRLLEGIVANPDRRLADLPLLTEPEKQQMLVEWNATQVEFGRPAAGTQGGGCLHELFEAQVERAPAAVAVVGAEGSLTYGELNRRANRLAHHLRGLGVGPEVLVGLCMERSLEMVVGLLGILKAGGAYVPLDPLLPPERLSFMLEDAQIAVLLSQQRLEDRLSKHQAQVVCLDEVGGPIEQESEENPISGVRAENLAYVIYTSGSTGKPKGVMIEHRCVLALLHGFEQVAPAGEQPIGTSVCQPSFDVSVFELFSALCFGGTLHILRPDTFAYAERLARYLLDHQVTSTYIPPALLEDVAGQLKSLGGPLSLDRILVGVEPIKQGVLQHFRDLSQRIRIVNGYGPAEATVCATLFGFQTATSPGQRTPIGTAMSGYQVYLVDPGLQPVPVGVPGEICIAGAGLARGYLNRPALTAESFLPDPFSHEPGGRLYRTGDLARYLPDGNIEFLWRQDHQVKIWGFRVELGEIEAILAQHPGVEQAVVVAREDRAEEKRLVGYIVPREGQAVVASELRRHLRGQLPEYMVPAVFVTLGAFPLTPNGKIDRRALPAPDTAHPELGEAFVAARTPVEQVLTMIWAKVLGLERIGVDDNFFELGGHSLLATRIISRIASTFQVTLPLSSLFEAPTIAALARALVANEPKPGRTQQIAEIITMVEGLSTEDARKLLQQWR